MGDGYRDTHMQYHRNSHAIGKSCPECGQKPDGTYEWNYLSDRQKIEDINRRLKNIEARVLTLEIQPIGPPVGEVEFPWTE